MTLPRPCPGPRAGSNQSAHHSHTLPDVLCRPKAVGLKAVDGRGPQEPVLERVVVGETALPDVAPVLAAWGQLVPPGKALLHEPTPRGVLPFGLGWQAPAGPGAVGTRVGPRDVHRGMRRSALQRRPGTLRAAPVRPPRPGATTEPGRQSAWGGNRRAAGGRTRRTTRSARRASRGRWRQQRQRTARWSPREPRWRTARRAPRAPGPSRSSGKPSGSSPPIRKVWPRSSSTGPGHHRAFVAGCGA